MLAPAMSRAKKRTPLAGPTRFQIASFIDITPPKWVVGTGHTLRATSTWVEPASLRTGGEEYHTSGREASHIDERSGMLEHPVVIASLVSRRPAASSAAWALVLIAVVLYPFTG